MTTKITKDLIDDAVASLFTGTLATNGTVTLPNGLIIKWGEETAVSGTTVITFTDAFPTACFQVVASDQSTGDTSGQDVVSILKTDPTVTGFEISTPSSVDKVRYIAIGN